MDIKEESYCLPFVSSPATPSPHQPQIVADRHLTLRATIIPVPSYGFLSSMRFPSLTPDFPTASGLAPACRGEINFSDSIPATLLYLTPGFRLPLTHLHIDGRTLPHSSRNIHSWLGAIQHTRQEFYGCNCGRSTYDTHISLGPRCTRQADTLLPSFHTDTHHFSRSGLMHVYRCRSQNAGGGAQTCSDSK